MKKLLSLFRTGILVFAITVCMQPLHAGIDGTAFGLGASAGYTIRSGFDSYLKKSAEVMRLREPLTNHGLYGLSGHIMFRENNFEIALGGSLSRTRNTGYADTGIYQITSKSQDIGIFGGMNVFIKKKFIFGGKVMYNMFSHDFFVSNNIPADLTNAITSNPSRSNGGSAMIRAEGGVALFTFGEARYSGIRLLANVDYGFMKYDFYNAGKHYLSGYTGDKKTNAIAFGFSVILFLGNGSPYLHP